MPGRAADRAAPDARSNSRPLKRRRTTNGCHRPKRHPRQSGHPPGGEMISASGIGLARGQRNRDPPPIARIIDIQNQGPLSVLDACDSDGGPQCVRRPNPQRTWLVVVAGLGCPGILRVPMEPLGVLGGQR
jgi:hypothetical protein